MLVSLFGFALGNLGFCFCWFSLLIGLGVPAFEFGAVVLFTLTEDAGGNLEVDACGRAALEVVACGTAAFEVDACEEEGLDDAG